jgi:predicted nucleotidyltransferase
VPTSVEQLLVKVSKALDKAVIPYMVIGGQAVLLYGTPRLTRDIDITLGINIDRLPEVSALARKFHLRIIPPNYREFVAQTMVLPLEDGKSKFRVDFIFSFTPYETQAIRRARKVKFGRAVVRFASLEDIIIHKIFSGRAKDIEDVKSIILKNHDFDRRYITKWLKEFESTAEGKPGLVRIFRACIS